MSKTRLQSLPEIREKLRRLLPEVRERYEVESLAFFGSYVRQEQRRDSDLDILVTFRATPGLIRFVQLEEFLEEALGVEVDLVMKESLKPRIGRRILSEAVPA